ncbi:MAG: protein-tyrosine phosphatase family protein [Microthrixaceae bacterium]
MTTWEAGDDIVEFPDGRRIRGRGLRRPVPDAPQPQFGVYLLGREPEQFDWESRWIPWPDFRLPRDTHNALEVLQDAFARAASQRVEIACHGGVGRTGTALAAVAVIAGVPSGEAVTWVRSQYRARAVETPWQRRWIRTIRQ